MSCSSTNVCFTPRIHRLASNCLLIQIIRVPMPENTSLASQPLRWVSSPQDAGGAALSPTVILLQGCWVRVAGLSWDSGHQTGFLSSTCTVPSAPRLFSAFDQLLICPLGLSLHVPLPPGWFTLPFRPGESLPKCSLSFLCILVITSVVWYMWLTPPGLSAPPRQDYLVLFQLYCWHLECAPVGTKWKCVDWLTSCATFYQSLLLSGPVFSSAGLRNLIFFSGFPTVVWKPLKFSPESPFPASIGTMFKEHTVSFHSFFLYIMTFIYLLLGLSCGMQASLAAACKLLSSCDTQA